MPAYVEEHLERAIEERKRRVMDLFRSWPALSEIENSELRKLWRERLALATRARGATGHQRPRDAFLAQHVLLRERVKDARKRSKAACVRSRVLILNAHSRLGG